MSVFTSHVYMHTRQLHAYNKKEFNKNYIQALKEIISLAGVFPLLLLHEEGGYARIQVFVPLSIHSYVLWIIRHPDNTWEPRIRWSKNLVSNKHARFSSVCMKSSSALHSLLVMAIEMKLASLLMPGINSSDWVGSRSQKALHDLPKNLAV